MSSAKSTSFQKKVRGKSTPIPGTKPSLHNNLLLVSSGVPSLDNVIGGGLAVGTVLLVEEDKYCSYSRLLLKYFLSEGVMSKHALLLASADVTCQQILKELPGPIVDDPAPGDTSTNQSSPGEKMTIAWRYESQPKQQPGAINKFGHYYDLTRTMDSGLLDRADLKTVDITDSFCESIPVPTGGMMATYSELLSSVKSRIEEGGFSTAQPGIHKNILRLGIHSLGSPLWGEEYGASGSRDPSLARFLYALRSLMRTSYAVCVVTVPSHLFQDPARVKSLQHLTDMVIRLESFAGTDNEHNPAYTDYHGLLHLVKLPRLSSLMCHMPDTLDLAFKLKRKKFMIERLHLPPDLSETASRNQEDPVKLLKSQTSGCGAGTGGNKLDF